LHSTATDGHRQLDVFSTATLLEAPQVSAVEVLDREGEIDLRVVVARLWSGRKWIAASALVVAAAFVVAAFVITPVYRSAAVALPVTADESGLSGLGSALGSLSGLASLAGIQLGGESSRLEEALAVLRSRQFVEKFIEDEQLLPQLFPRKWDEREKRWTVADSKVPTLAEGYKRFDKKFRTVTHDKKTNLVTVAVEWPDRAAAARMANELIARLNAEMRDRAITRTNAAVGYLQKELDATTAVDTRAAISRLMESQINQRMYANVTQEYALRVIDRAMASDPKDVAKPKSLMLLALGVTLGIVLGGIGVLAAPALSARRAG
jgi:uncharacterized protein involved in exopolysaccharide biosynthesis